MMLLILIAVQFILILLKLTGQIDWKWWEVLSIFIAFLAISLVGLLLLTGTFAFTMMVASHVE